MSRNPRGCRVAWGHPRLRLRRLYSSFLLTRPAQARQCRPRERARPYFPPPSNLRTPFTACSTRSCGQTDSRPPSFAYIPKVRTVPWRSFRGSVTNRACSRRRRRRESARRMQFERLPCRRTWRAAAKHHDHGSRMPEGINPESSGRRRTIQDHQSWARSSRWSSPDLLIMPLPGYDSYDRRLSSTISERFFACLTTAPQACLPQRQRQRDLIRFCSRPDCSPPGGPTRRAPSGRRARPLVRGRGGRASGGCA